MNKKIFKKRSGDNEIRRLTAEATSLETTMQRLEYLSLSEYDVVREAVACNPNTPVKVLINLWSSFGKTIIHQNPILTLWEFSGKKDIFDGERTNHIARIYADLLNIQPERLDSIISRDMRLRLINSSDLTPEFGIFLARDPDARVRIAFVKSLRYGRMLDALPGGYLHDLARDEDDKVRMALAEAIRSLGDLAQHGKFAILVSCIKILAESGDSETLNIVKKCKCNGYPIFTFLKMVPQLAEAQNPRSNRSSLLKLSRSEFWEVRYALACNPSSPPKALLHLWRRHGEWIVKGNPIITEMRAHELSEIRRRARVPALFRIYADLLKYDPRKLDAVLPKEFRLGLLDAGGKPPGSDAVFAIDPDPEVRMGFIERVCDGRILFTTPGHLLLSLAKDKKHRVRLCFAKNLQKVRDWSSCGLLLRCFCLLLNDKNKLIIRALSRCQNLPPSVKKSKNLP
jgi:hypothetical protein